MDDAHIEYRARQHAALARELYLSLQACSGTLAAPPVVLWTTGVAASALPTLLTPIAACIPPQTCHGPTPVAVSAPATMSDSVSSSACALAARVLAVHHPPGSVL